MTDQVPILFLTEGDAETWASLSGCSRSALMAMRRAGRDVRTADVFAYGFADWFTKAATFRPQRARWAQRYHASPLGFHLRSVRARRLAASHPAGAPVLQMGATFDAGERGTHPLYCLCDANSAFAAKGGSFGPVAHLNPRELRTLLARERRVYSRCIGIFTFTEGLRRSFIEDFGVRPERVITTFAGPNLEFFPTDEDLTRPKATDPTVLFIGKRFERKGGPTLVAAFQRVRAVIPNARLLLAGCRPEVGSLPGVEVLGLVGRDDPSDRGLKALFLSSDIFCMPSRYEPFGMVFSEAMVHGLPCVGPRAYMSEIISDCRTGWLVDADDVDGLAAVLIKALRDRTRLRAMGLEGRRRALEFFNWDRVARLMLDHMDRTRP